MRFDALLRAHASMKVERPPEIWEADTEDVRFAPLLGEMIAASLNRGALLQDLTLNVSNVVVEHDPDPEGEARRPWPGEYVAVTVSGPADLGPDGAWPAPDSQAAPALLDFLHERLTAAGAHYAYVRRLPSGGSLTVFLPRLSGGDGVSYGHE